MSKNFVNWFEIPVKDMDRAKKFYSSVFGEELSESDMGPNKMAFFPMPENEITGVGGALIAGPAYEPNNRGTTVYFNVEDCNNELAKIEANGGKVTVKKTSIGEHGYIAHFEDTEGNRVALHSRK